MMTAFASGSCLLSRLAAHLCEAYQHIACPRAAEVSPRQFQPPVLDRLHGMRDRQSELRGRGQQLQQDNQLRLLQSRRYEA